MPIVVNLDVMLARRKMRSRELAERIAITEQNVSLLKSGKVKGIRFDTLEAICRVLDCSPATSSNGGRIRPDPAVAAAVVALPDRDDGGGRHDCHTAVMVSCRAPC